jgi:ABC-2 type transport system ATP-binding protein
MIQVCDAHKQFAKKYALKNFSFQFASGESYALLGTNGAGKSTLIKSMMGLVHLDRGSISTQDSIAYLPEQPYLPESMTPWQLLDYACRNNKISSERIEQVLKEVQLKPSAWKSRIAKFSKGMKQRVALAYTLAGNPDWFILDEPMSGLDVMGRSLVRDIFIQRHAEGCGMIMCSHTVTDIIQLCKHVLIMVDGALLETVEVHHGSLEEAEYLESRLRYWYNDKTNQ